MSQKIIITLWRAEIKIDESHFGVYCSLKYGSKQSRSKTIHNIKQLNWKQSFVFPLEKKNAQLKLQFIGLTEGEKIHYAGDHVTETMSFGKAHFQISRNNINKGTIPKKMQIIGENQKVIGKVFIQYELLQSQVKYLIHNQSDYNYVIILSNIKVSFIQHIDNIPSFHFKTILGDVSKIEQFPFIKQKKLFYYNYPVKLYIKEEKQLKIELSTIDNGFIVEFQNNKNSTIVSKSTQTESIDKLTRKKSSLEINKVFAKIQLDYSNSKITEQKIPIFLSPNRQIGFLSFQMQILFKTKQQIKHQNNKEIESKEKRKRHILKNGNIIINSIKAKLQPSNTQYLKNHNFGITATMGKQTLQSSLVQNPGPQLIFIENFRFKRSWEQNIRFQIVMEFGPQDIRPVYFASTNLKELFQVGRLHAQHIFLYDQSSNYCGQIIIDVCYNQMEDKKKQLDQKEDQQTEQKIKQLEKFLKLQKIKKKLKERQEKKINKSVDFGARKYSLPYPSDFTLPTISESKIQKGITENQSKEFSILLKQFPNTIEVNNLSNVNNKDYNMISLSPSTIDNNYGSNINNNDHNLISLSPTRTIDNNYGSNIHNKDYNLLSLSPTTIDKNNNRYKNGQIKAHNMLHKPRIMDKNDRYNFYTKGHNILFSQSPRFKQNKQSSNQPFLFRKPSDFQNNNKKGPFIGYGQKVDFTKQLHHYHPGVGKYNLPSIWDRYI